MSTNYYVRPPGTADGEEGIHLGKWANGEFSFRAYPDAANRPAEVTWDVVDYESWVRLLSLGQVESEYGTPLTAAEMEAEVVPDRRWARAPIYERQFTDKHGNRFSPYEFC